MPLNKSGSKAAIGQNIKAEEAAGKPHDQAVAIALNTDRKAGGGHAGPAPAKHNSHGAPKQGSKVKGDKHGATHHG
jgi:hypothetical protein